MEMYQQPVIESSPSALYLKCAKCYQYLTNPIQLSACLHILCTPCFHDLEQSTTGNIICPNCKQHNARPSVLKSIAGMDESSRNYNSCDYCEKLALWNCFICAKNFCGPCRPRHDNVEGNKGHQLVLLPLPPTDLQRKIFESSNHQQLQEDLSSGAPALLEVEALDGGVQCPLCVNSSGCSHAKVLEKLYKQPDSKFGLCEIPGHGSQGKQNKLKFFCRECWKPVCGDCSQRGDHKMHNTGDLISLNSYLKESINQGRSQLTMLDKRLEMEILVENEVQQCLQRHIEETDYEIKSRKCKIIEDATAAFNDVVKQIELTGKDILNEYKINLQKLERSRKLLNLCLKALDNLKVDDSLNVPQYNNVFQCQQLIHKFGVNFLNLMTEFQKEKPQQRQLVLPQTVIPSMQSLAKVSTEWKHLKLLFKFPLNGDFSLVHSIVAIGGEECLLSCQNLNSDEDVILQCHYLMEDGRQKTQFHDVVKGRYLIAQTSNGEIVASFAREKDKSYAIQYNDGSFLNSMVPDKVFFAPIKQISYPAFGIAATNDDKIIVCYQVAEKKGMHGILKLSLQGKVLSDTLDQPKSNLISPKYVAVSNSGAIAASDTEGSSVVILDRELKVSERINFPLPTAFHEDSRKCVFQPHGLCYDSYERIIVTDPDNDSIIRFHRDDSTHRYNMEPLLNKSTDKDFVQPRLVTMSQDSRLWVVCRAHVFVYDYCS